MDQVVECPHCGERIFVLEMRQPITEVERDEGGQRSFVMIGKDSWLIHQCLIPSESE